MMAGERHTLSLAVVITVPGRGYSAQDQRTVCEGRAFMLAGVFAA
jgi:hypothetical protein